MLTDKERKLLHLALGAGAYDGEIANAAVMFLRSLRERAFSAEQIEKLLDGSATAEIVYVETEPSKPDYGLCVMPFGKHKGKEFREMPVDYFDWLLGTLDPNDPKWGARNAILIKSIESFLAQ